MTRENEEIAMTHSTSPATSEQRAAAVRLVDANALREKFIDSKFDGLRRVDASDVVDLIDAAPSIVPPETPEGRWIAVADRLPANGNTVLAANADGLLPYIATFGEGRWYHELHDPDITPSHWCSLPSTLSLLKVIGQVKS